MSLESRYREIITRAKSASNGRDFTLIAVSKKQSLEDIETLYRLGQRDFGENYVQELVEKSDHFLRKEIRDIRWHFIGHLQTNKVKTLLPLVHTIHSIDNLRVAKEIETRGSQMGLEAVPCFIEVNIDEEPSKTGTLPKDTPALAKSISKFNHLLIEGLMCIPKPVASFSTQTGQSFQSLFELEKQCVPFTHGKLSMGMSDDFELALQKGATHIRVGTALFGPRK